VNHLPKKPDYVEMEKRMQAFWQTSNIFDKLRAKNRGNRPFSFVDGPITANNPMGVHHARGRTLKDVFLRYKAMNGLACHYQNGFDCQGLWVEVEVEKALGYQGKRDIESHGLADFARACRRRVKEYSAIITEQSKRLGQWMDWEHSYYTHTDENILGIWHFLKRCDENGWLYRKALPMPWCPRCGTSLSEHEMGGSYRTLTHQAVFIHVPLRDDSNRHLLLWTTTPWTLCANVAAAVHPALTYVEVRCPEWDHSLILCEEALGVLEHIPLRRMAQFKGEVLLGSEYETFFPDFPAQRGLSHRVIPWQEVSAEEGSGIVHIAPGCGMEDFGLASIHGLPSPCPVDGLGIFREGYGWMTGKNCTAAAGEIINDLDQQGKLLRAEEHAHSYPVCWRCKTDLIFRLVEEWFIRCDEIRPRLIEAARSVEWTPVHVGKRMEDWLNNMGDWCISRKRYWGLPLPFYVCRGCNHVTVVGSRDEFRAVATDSVAVDQLSELHRPWIDDVKVRCERCAAEVRRVPEVGDCWLDAGIVPYSTLGYFTDRDHWAKAFPAEWVCEMREQVRLWFYSMLFMGVTISGRSPYRKVLAYERVVAEDGSMFSKTGHMIHFDEAVEALGADPMRYLYCSQPVWADLRFGYALVDHIRRKLDDLWNIAVFFTTYAHIDKVELPAQVAGGARHVTDRWLFARTAQMLDDVTASYDRWDTPAVLRATEIYIDDVSNWYVRVNRRRFWRNAYEADKQACYSAMLTAIESVAAALAPVTPHLCEELWQRTTRIFRRTAPDSVHLASWPRVPDPWRNTELLEQTVFVRHVISLSRNLREQTQLRVRQPVKALYVVCDVRKRRPLKEHEQVIMAELNVKQLILLDSETPLEDAALRLDLREAGPVLREDVGRLRSTLEGLNDEAMGALVRAHKRGETISVPGYETPLPARIFQVKRLPRPHLAATREGDVYIAVDTTLTEELVQEGAARDFVRRVQVLRRDLGLDVQDRIMIRVATDERLAAALLRHRDYILAETLADEMCVNAPAQNNWVQWELDGEPARVAVVRTNVTST